MQAVTQSLSDGLGTIVGALPTLIAAVLILVLATLLANFVAGLVRGATGSDVTGSIAQYGIIVFAAFAALTQLGIAEELIAPTFLILLGSVALAAALAFGFGGRDVAQEVVEGYYERRDEAKQQIREQRQEQRQDRRPAGCPLRPHAGRARDEGSQPPQARVIGPPSRPVGTFDSRVSAVGAPSWITRRNKTWGRNTWRPGQDQSDCGCS